MNRLRTLIFAICLATAGASVASPAFAQDKGKKSKAEAEKKAEAEEPAEAEEGATEEAAATQASSASTLQRGNRMEFDARLIRGERASGAVFLFQRATRPLPSMVKRRTSYLDDTVATTLGEGSAVEFRKNQSEAIAKRLKAEEEERRKARESAKAEEEKATAAEKSEKSDASDKSDKSDKKGKKSK